MSSTIKTSLLNRGCKLYHAINLKDFVTYAEKGELLSRQELEKHSKSITKFASDASDKERGLWGRTFANLTDFGAVFWQWEFGVPNAYGPITLVFKPEIFESMIDCALTLKGAIKPDFDLEKDRVKTVDQLNTYFVGGEKSYQRNWLRPQARYAELSCENNTLSFDYLEAVIVEPIETKNGSLSSIVREILNSNGFHHIAIWGRDTTKLYGTQLPILQQLYGISDQLQGNIENLDSCFDGDLQDWYLNIKSKNSVAYLALYRWFQYIFDGTSLYLDKNNLSQSKSKFVIGADPMTEVLNKMTTAQELLPAWFIPRMMSDCWHFALVLTTGKTMKIQSISNVCQAADGSIWIDVDMHQNDNDGDECYLTAPTSRTRASVNVAHIVAAYELADT